MDDKERNGPNSREDGSYNPTRDLNGRSGIPLRKPIDPFGRTLEPSVADQRTPSRPTSLAAVADDVGSLAESARHQLGDTVSGLGASAKQAAKATFKAVSEQASALTSSVADELTTSAESEKARGADAVDGFAKAIESAAGELDHQSPQIARAFRSAARGVEGLSSNLRQESIGELFMTGANYAKGHPLTFFAGAVVAGFAASRFLLSHKPDADTDRAEASSPLGASLASSSKERPNENQG